MNNVISHMQTAVDAVQDSPHETSKVAASLVFEDGQVITTYNGWPPAIENAFGREARIGNASGTVHAETFAIIIAAQKNQATQDAQLFITDPPCPNCAKNMAEAGITEVYIDHKGFEKDFAIRRMSEFEDLSLAVFRHAGIAVHKLYRKEERLETLLKPFSALVPIQEMENASYARCTAYNAAGKAVEITAAAHPSLGYDAAEPELESGKYSYILQPLNRLLMMTARQGLRIDPDSVFSSRIPTSRELVNIIGAGIQTLNIGDINEARDIHGPKALRQLECAKVLHVKA